jgi:hypothetical protein
MTIKPYDKAPTIYSYLKVYPEMAKFIEYTTPYNVPAYYDASVKSSVPSKARSGTNSQELDEQSHLDSLRRSKTNISDIVLSNRFDMWATFTFNGKKENEKKLGLKATTDRYDVELCKKKMSRWLNKQQTQHGRFEYLIVAEYHKDGALHFHAFMHNYKGNIEKTTYRKHGRDVYRIKSYQLGISDMQYIEQTPDDYKRISSYIKKYITKDMPIFSGRKRYWCSTGLVRPDIIKNPSVEKLENYIFEIKRKLDNLTISHGTVIMQ